MKVAGDFELESMQVSPTLGDEFGIYFLGEEKRNLAFAFSTAKKAISSIKKLKKVLQVQYNIEKDVLDTASTEEEKKQIQEQKEGIKPMANVKRGVNVKQLCRAAIGDGLTAEEILAQIATVYTDEGKDEKYAKGRARSVYSSICKEKGLAPPKRKKRGKKTEAAETTETTEPTKGGEESGNVADQRPEELPNTTPESPADNVETAEGSETPTEGNPPVQEEVEGEMEETEEVVG